MEKGFKALVDGLKNIVLFIKVLYKLVVNLVTGVYKMLSWVMAVVTKVVAIILTLPDYIQIFATITLTISIIYLIVGRNHGKSDT